MKDARERIVWPYRTHESKMLHGAGSSARLGPELDYLEVDRALLLCGPNAAKGRTVETLKQTLGSRLVEVFTEVKPHASIATVHEVAALATKRRIDVVICVGGGSTSDTGKGVVSQLGEGKPIETLNSEFRPPDTYIEQYLKKPKLPLISIPGTFSGAEVGPGFPLKDSNNIKRLHRGDFVASRILVLDPEATLDTDLQVLVESGGNGLAHGIEGLYSRARQPISDTLCDGVISQFTKYLPLLKREPEELPHRMNLLYASVMGGWLVTNARMGIHHGVCHCLGARIGLSHGRSNSLMLPYSMKFNLDVTVPAQARAAAAMGIDTRGMDEEKAALAGIDRIHALKAELDVPARLRDLPSVPTDEMLKQVAEDCMNDRALYFNPKRVASAEEVLPLLRDAF